MNFKGFGAITEVIVCGRRSLLLGWQVPACLGSVGKPWKVKRSGISPLPLPGTRGAKSALGCAGRRRQKNNRQPFSREEKPGGALLPLAPGAVPAAEAGRTVSGDRGARTRGLFKSRGRAGPGRAGAAAGGGGGGVRGARAAPAPRRAQPCAAPPAAARGSLGSARLGLARHGQPSPASPGPPRLGPRWSPLPRSGGEPRVGAAAGVHPAAEVRGGGGRGAARHGPAQHDTARHGTDRRGLPARPALGAAAPELRGRVSPDPPHENYFGSFYPVPGGAGRRPLGRSGRAPTPRDAPAPAPFARLFGKLQFPRRGFSEWKMGGPRETEEDTTLSYSRETLRESLLFR